MHGGRRQVHSFAYMWETQKELSAPSSSRLSQPWLLWAFCGLKHWVGKWISFFSALFSNPGTLELFLYEREKIKSPQMKTISVCFLFFTVRPWFSTSRLQVRRAFLIKEVHKIEFYTRAILYLRSETVLIKFHVYSKVIPVSMEFCSTCLGSHIFP